MSKATEKMTEDTMDTPDSEDAPSSAPKARAVRGNGAAAAEGSFTWWRNTWTIAVREFKSYFDSLVAYIVLGVGLLALGVQFFLLQDNFWQFDRATMGRMFAFMPEALPIIFALVTMRSLAEEKRMGTIELLITLPVRDSEVIMGKYLGALGLVTTLLLGSIVIPIALFVWPWNFGPLDWGPVWAGYLGLFFYSAAGVAIGMLFSSITESQIIAFFVTLLALAGLYEIGRMVESLPGVAGDALSFISFRTRFGSFERGIIDTRALLYFASIAVICLVVTFRNLESRKWK